MHGLFTMLIFHELLEIPSCIFNWEIVDIFKEQIIPILGKLLQKK